MEIKAQDSVPELSELDSMQAMTLAEKDQIQVVLMGGIDAHCHALLNALIGLTPTRKNSALGYCYVDCDGMKKSDKGH